MEEAETFIQDDIQVSQYGFLSRNSTRLPHLPVTKTERPKERRETQSIGIIICNDKP
jgi:hypothetical protein